MSLLDDMLWHVQAVQDQYDIAAYRYFHFTLGLPSSTAYYIRTILNTTLFVVIVAIILRWAARAYKRYRARVRTRTILHSRTFFLVVRLSFFSRILSTLALPVP